jgi:gamma-glutamyltranspeptidase/glutathione hydrolase
VFTTRPELAGTFGMSASTHWLASQTAMAVLEQGGNAFDAAVAAGFVLQVVEPHLNGPGGEVPIVAWVAREARPTVVCGQGVAPGGASLDAFADLGLSLIPGTGLLPACVPGAFGGWMLLLQRYGTMRLAEVLRYAIDYANGGFPVVGRITDTIAAVSDLFRTHWPTSAATWLDGGGPPRSSPIPTWRRRTAGSWPRPQRPRPTGTRRSRRPSAPSTGGSSPTPSMHLSPRAR